MSDVNLKEYTLRAVELEAAIYTQKTLMDKHKQIRKEQTPSQPTKKSVTKPTPPEMPTADAPNQISNVAWYCFAGLYLAVAVFLIGTAFYLFGLGGGAEGFLALAIAGGLIYLLYYIYKKRKEKAERWEYRLSVYRQEYRKYADLMSQYSNDVATADREYDTARNQYANEIAVYNAKTNQLLAQHNDALSLLEKALQALYDENVVYPKYRNMVAMTTINEYLMSGRCSELEGPNGAYNLYEMELRQNIIINQLSNIINNLEQIRNGQFLLYRELMKANDTVEQICYELRKLNTTAKLDAYFNAVAAQAAISPKITRGIIY